MTKFATLPDGQQVPTDSELWRHHCEAMTLCQLPTRDLRRAHLEAVERIRGPKARQVLEATALRLWELRLHARSETG